MIAFDAHNHDHCIADAVASVEAHCAEAGLKLTPVRRRALEVLLEEHRAMGAYEVLEKLNEDGLGSQPPVAYRALDFLVSNGFAHRVEHLNAFVACIHPGDDHAPTLLICRDCKAVAETPSAPVNEVLDKLATASGFAVEHTSVEVQGLCPKCQDSAT